MRIFAVIALCLCFASLAFSGDINVQSSWFKPTIVENYDASCDVLLKDVQQKFFSSETFGAAYGVQGYGYPKTGSILNWTILGGASSGQVEAFGKTYYLDYINNPGCGGACETNQMLVSDTPFPMPRDRAYLQALAEHAPSATSDSYTMARNPDGDIYIFSIASSWDFKNQILIYKLAREGRWAPACKISVAPEHLDEAAPVKQTKILDSLAALQQAVWGVMGDAGNCGSMGTLGRWREGVRESLQDVLYRPWALIENDTDSSYEGDLENLKQWSLLGFGEYRAFSDFENHLRETTTQLANFYHEANGWPLDASREMASATLKAAASAGIRFYMYDPGFAEGEEVMRRLILSKQDINVIRSTSLDAEHTDERGESILNIAIQYPEALNYLLQKGIHNDLANNFGKTPLMYAAQNNQFESAALLIEHGANANAATTKPFDSCFYTLQTFNMTPLHYAVRYASPELIKLLLDNGAQPLLTAQNHHNRPATEETPLDWLHRYTGQDAAEKNPNIPADRIAEIEQWLQPPAPQQAQQLANDHVLKAEDHYRKNNLELAYREISLAVQLQPDNARAQADLSLIAVKSGNLRESLQASQKLIDSSSDDKIKASAWFNQGLACEKADRAHLYFNGRFYCTYGLLYPYRKAYEAAPTDARRNKLKALFEEQSVPYCEISTGTAGIRINFQLGSDPEEKERPLQLQTFYVLHDKTLAIAAEDLAWEAAFSDGSVKKIVPENVASLDLDQQVISIFSTSITSVQFPYKVFNGICKRADSAAQ